MQRKFINQPNALFVQFGLSAGQILASSISCKDKIVLIRVSSFHYTDVLELSEPSDCFNYYRLLLSLIDENISFVSIAYNFEIVRTYQKTEFLRSFNLY